jgi:hypothetical protein
MFTKAMNPTKDHFHKSRKRPQKGLRWRRCRLPIDMMAGL